MDDAPLMRFAPGVGTAFVTPDRIAITGSAGDSSTARTLRSLVVRGVALADAMTELSRLGFGSLDTFAVVIAECDGNGAITARVLHRGHVTVRVERAAGAAVLFHQPQIATWREEVVDAALAVRIDLGAGTAVALTHWVDGPGELPASSLSWSPRPVDAVLVQVSVDDAIDLPAAAAVASGSVHHSGAARIVEPIVTVVEPAASVEIEPVVEPEVVTAVVVPVVVEPVAGVEPPPVVAQPPGEADDIDFANLVHHTMYRSPEEAAVRVTDAHPVTPPPSLPPPGPADRSADPSASDETRAWLDGAGSGVINAVPVPGAPVVETLASDPDHDGHTVARRPGRPGQASPSAPPSTGGRPMVHAVSCPSGHLNPPSASACRMCALPIADRSARTEPRPQLGALRFSTGQIAVVDGPLLIGRNPPSGAELDGERATAVAIDDSEISRYHLALHVADWYVSVEDQGSMNGTVVRAPGKPDQTLRPFERVQVVVGTVVDVGGAISFRYDAT
jgi:hypothetical protein